MIDIFTMYQQQIQGKRIVPKLEEKENLSPFKILSRITPPETTNVNGASDNHMKKKPAVSRKKNEELAKPSPVKRRLTPSAMSSKKSPKRMRPVVTCSLVDSDVGLLLLVL